MLGYFYYSYEGNTEELVKGIQEVIHADVLKLIPKNMITNLVGI